MKIESVTVSEASISWKQIRERAYELWERNHRPEGREIELWLMAERELKAALAKRQRAAAAEAAPQNDPVEAASNPESAPDLP